MATPQPPRFVIPPFAGLATPAGGARPAVVVPAEAREATAGTSSSSLAQSLGSSTSAPPAQAEVEPRRRQSSQPELSTGRSELEHEQRRRERQRELTGGAAAGGAGPRPSATASGRPAPAPSAGSVESMWTAKDLLSRQDAILATLRKLSQDGGLHVEKQYESTTLAALRSANLPTTRADNSILPTALPPTSLSPPPTSGNFLDAFHCWHSWSRKHGLVTFPIAPSAVAVFLNQQARSTRRTLAALLDAYRKVTSGAFTKIPLNAVEVMGEDFVRRWKIFAEEAARSVWDWVAVRELVGPRLRVSTVDSADDRSQPSSANASPKPAPRHPDLVVRLQQSDKSMGKRKAALLDSPKLSGPPMKKPKHIPVPRNGAPWTQDDQEEADFMTAAAQLQTAMAALFVHRRMHLQVGFMDDGVQSSGPVVPVVAPRMPQVVRVGRFGPKHIPSSLPYSDYTPSTAPMALTPALNYVPPLSISLPQPVALPNPTLAPPLLADLTPIPSPRTLLAYPAALLPISPSALTLYHSQSFLHPTPLPSLATLLLTARVTLSHFPSHSKSSTPLFGGDPDDYYAPIKLSSTSFVVPALLPLPPRAVQAPTAKTQERARQNSRDAIVQRAAASAAAAMPSLPAPTATPTLGGFAPRASFPPPPTHKRVTSVSTSVPASATTSRSASPLIASSALAPTPTTSNTPTPTPTPSSSRPLSRVPSTSTSSPTTTRKVSGVHPLASIYAQSTPDERAKFFDRLAKQGIELSPRSGKRSPLPLPGGANLKGKGRMREPVAVGGVGGEGEKGESAIGLGLDVGKGTREETEATKTKDADKTVSVPMEMDGPELVAIGSSPKLPPPAPAPAPASTTTAPLPEPTSVSPTLPKSDSQPQPQPDPQPQPPIQSQQPTPQPAPLEPQPQPQQPPPRPPAPRLSWAPAPPPHSPPHPRPTPSSAVAPTPSPGTTTDPRVRPTPPSKAVFKLRQPTIVKRDVVVPRPSPNPSASSSSFQSPACVGCLQAKRKCGEERPCSRCKSSGNECVPSSDRPPASAPSTSNGVHPPVTNGVRPHPIASTAASNGAQPPPSNGARPTPTANGSAPSASTSNGVHSRIPPSPTSVAPPPLASTSTSTDFSSSLPSPPPQPRRRLSISSETSTLSALSPSPSPSPEPEPPRRLAPLPPHRYVVEVIVPPPRRGMSLKQAERFAHSSTPRRPFG